LAFSDRYSQCLTKFSFAVGLKEFSLWQRLVEVDITNRVLGRKNGVKPIKTRKLTTYCQVKKVDQKPIYDRQHPLGLADAPQ